MGTKRTDSPVITINAMVRVGPWTVEQVHHGKWRQCDRCETDHKEVWVCTVNADESAIGALNGRRTWLIGSTCGPTLMLVSALEWRAQTKDLKRIIRLLLDARRAIEGARKHDDRDFYYLELIAARAELLRQGLLDRQQQRVMRHHVSGVLTTLRRLEQASDGSAEPE